MPKTPKRIVGPAQVATGPATVYTVPALTKTVLRYLHIQNPSASPVNLSISIGADAAATRIYDTYSIPAKAAGVTDSVRQIWLNEPMEAAEILQLSAGTNNVLVITITADEYTLG
jgi:hypothetical protein